MSDHLHARPTPLVTMADGTIKQINPFSGTEVWTVPGRGNRPLSVPAANPQPLGPDAHTATCAFCSANKLSTPPEKSRMVQDAREAGRLIDATYKRRTRAVMIMDSGHIVLSAIQPETIAGRMANEREEAE